MVWSEGEGSFCIFEIIVCILAVFKFEFVLVLCGGFVKIIGFILRVVYLVGVGWDLRMCII